MHLWLWASEHDSNICDSVGNSHEQVTLVEHLTLEQDSFALLSNCINFGQALPSLCPSVLICTVGDNNSTYFKRIVIKLNLLKTSTTAQHVP